MEKESPENKKIKIKKSIQNQERNGGQNGALESSTKRRQKIERFREHPDVATESCINWDI